MLKSTRPSYAIIVVAISAVYMCATFLPLCYSILLPNKDIERVVTALRDGGAAPSEAATVVDQVRATVGYLTESIQIAYYSGAIETFHLGTSNGRQTTKVLQATYIAWFQERPRPTLFTITQYSDNLGRKAYRINESNSTGIVRAYMIPILLFGISLFWVRKRKPSATMFR